MVNLRKIFRINYDFSKIKLGNISNFDIFLFKIKKLMVTVFLL